VANNTDDPDYGGEVTPARRDTGSHRPPPTSPEWALHAWAELKASVHEVAGPDANPRILRYFKATTLAGNPMASSDETPWCSAFACWCMEEAKVRSPRNTMAKSWLSWGSQLPLEKDPPYGTVCVFWRGTPSSASGHVGFFAGSEKTDVWVLGGNQFNSVSFAKYPRMRLLGFRWPTVIAPKK
jgi:uncharacterized protein (TIGR02594 family)